MIAKSAAEPRRLRAYGAAKERELLDSALGDRPHSRVRDAAIGRVLAARRGRRRLVRGLAFGSSSLALAAGLVLYQMRSAPPMIARAETVAPSVSVRATAASANPELDSEFSPCPAPAVAAGNQPLIDDFEDGDSRVPVLEHRAGNWYAYNDGTGVQQPKGGSAVVPKRIAGSDGSNQFALFTSGGKFKKWGAVLNFEFSPRRCYDASAYAGIEFSARGRGSLWLSIKMTQVITEEYGGSCKHDCYDGHQKLIRLEAEFQKYRIRWEDLSQSGFGPKLAFDPHSLHSLELSVRPEQTPFGFWVDDVRFIRR